MKHRKLSGSASQHCSATPSSVVDDGAPVNATASNRKRIPSSSLVLTTVAILTLVTVSHLSLPVKPSGGAQLQRSSRVRSALEDSERENVQESDDPTSASFGLRPLLGMHEFDGEGTVIYPTIDLSTSLSEESKDPIALQMYMPSLSLMNTMSKTKDSRSFLIEDNIPAPVLDVIDQGSDHALLTRQGYKPGGVPNQDRLFLARYVGSAIESGFLIGIADGHGGSGHKVAHHAGLNLPRTFGHTLKSQSKGIDFDSNVEAALKEAFKLIDETEPCKGEGGSTLSVLFYPGHGTKCYVANTGDSTTLIVRVSNKSKKATIVYENRQHKPHLEEERKRIESKGGSIMVPPSLLFSRPESEDEDESTLKESSRVFIPNPAGQLALAMSRSIGDFDGKAVGLIAEPDVDVFDIKEQQSPEKGDKYFVVSASDGLYDVLRKESVVQYLATSLYDSNSQRTLPWTCEILIREASRLWLKSSAIMHSIVPYRDDISIGVAKINFDPT
mmetsp:Transcript_8960/g.20835  ORF Transcript_8960/g.20835 Transcript_8960/m.20835 type:complete len:500 (+) Transcript_8960:153-1652(+)